MSKYKKGYRFRTSSAPKSTRGHYEVFILNKDKLFTCPEGGRKFMTQTGLENHLVKYHGIFKEAV